MTARSSTCAFCWAAKKITKSDICSKNAADGKPAAFFGLSGIDKKVQKGYSYSA